MLCLVLPVTSLKSVHIVISLYSAADPGFPIGWGADLLGGGSTNFRCGHFLAEMYVKKKELGSVGGMHRWCPLDLPLVLELQHTHKHTLTRTHYSLSGIC